ncbi:carboxypeptidase-like regulatory domain-containing protein [Gemmata sp. JC717]|uniref:carboxypeptidase-like regulatory domain-containing protein n=1 Tax=Gemmata algarum TaxID=2975278 RepID=UPI0021BA9FB4|nr:carboxypeptidase-like regulatory domain-containing protein [Gemmata algarum]MDY3553621.1 carboxypeptidase-like regulatory domain-containing protein [Gemmata algarum]
MRLSGSRSHPIALGLLGALLCPGTAHAHAMSASVEVRPEVVRVIVYFEDDLPAERATVTVTNAAGAEIASGTADEHGVCSFSPPPPGEYKLVANSAGHTARVTFVVAQTAEAGAPAEFATPSVNRPLGLALGIGGLLGASALFWLFRRRS